MNIYILKNVYLTHIQFQVSVELDDVTAYEIDLRRLKGVIMVERNKFMLPDYDTVNNRIKVRIFSFHLE